MFFQCIIVTKISAQELFGALDGFFDLVIEVS